VLLYFSKSKLVDNHEIVVVFIATTELLNCRHTTSTCISDQRM